MNPITLIDYKTANLGSIMNMIKKLGGSYRVATGPSDLGDAEKILLPGVGAFDHAMELLGRLGFTEALREKVMVDKVPTLGICLGMQIMTEYSEEGDAPGLGFISGGVKKFKLSLAEGGLKVPHMGWNRVRVEKSTRLFENMDEKPRFYFTHSYHVCDIPSNAKLLLCDYGYEFIAGFEQENIIGLQFHPEKSSVNGLKILKNFIEKY